MAQLTKTAVDEAMAAWNIRYRKPYGLDELALLAVEFWEDLVAEGITSAQLRQASRLIRRRNRWFPSVPEIVEAAREVDPSRAADCYRALAAPDDHNDRYSEAQVERNKECARIFGQAAAKVINFEEATRMIKERLAVPL